MLTRRHLLTLSALTGLLLAAGPRVWAPGVRAQGSGGAGEATATVVKLGNELVQIVNGAGSAEEKKRQIQPRGEAAVDVDGIAHFCLGRFVRSATPAQLQDYTHLFHDVLLNNITGKIGEFQGVSFKPTTTTTRDNDILVGTLITRPNQQPNNVQWVVEQVAGRPKIVDVVAEGTSLRLTQRSDYSAYMSRNGNNVEALINAMRSQLDR